MVMMTEEEGGHCKRQFGGGCHLSLWSRANFRPIAFISSPDIIQHARSAKLDGPMV